MCLRENSLTEASWWFGGAGGGGRIGSSTALDTARNERRSEAVTRVAEVQGVLLRILKSCGGVKQTRRRVRGEESEGVLWSLQVLLIECICKTDL